MPRRAAAAVALALLTLTWAGCESDEDPDSRPTADPTVSVGEAQRIYSPLMSQLSSAIAATTQQPPPAVTQEVTYYDDDLQSCAYAAHLTFPDVVFGTDVPWDDVRKAADAALSESGFSLTDQLDVPGGYNGFDATAADGAAVQVRSKTADPSTVAIHAPVTGTCPNEAGQTLEPLDR